jgi:hypothetical protein
VHGPNPARGYLARLGFFLAARWCRWRGKRGQGVPGFGVAWRGKRGRERGPGRGAGQLGDQRAQAAWRGHAACPAEQGRGKGANGWATATVPSGGTG